MRKTIKRIIIGVLIAAVIVGAVWGVLTLIKNSRKAPVNVFAVSDIAMTDSYMDSAESYGTVTTDKIQKIYLYEGQSVNEVYVTEGQTVKIGDPLLAIDTTLAELQVEKADIALQKKQLALKTAEADLKSVSNAASREYLESRLRELEAKLDAELERLAEEQGGTITLPYGIGTEESPLYIERKSNLDLVPEELLADTDDIWLALVTTFNGNFIDYQGIHFYKEKTEEKDILHFTVFEPAALEVPEIEPSDEVESLNKQIDRVYSLMSYSYSASDIARMKVELNKQISDLEIEIKIADIDLKKMQKQMNDGVITAEFDGEIKAVREPDEAYISGQAVVELSGGGGYYITGAVSELEMYTVQIGQPVSVTSFRDWNIYEGEVCEIGDYPVTNADAWTNGNNNVSWYPFKVFVSEDAELQEYDYVRMSYSAATQESGWYLEKMFVRTENGRSYVYKLGDDDTLTKQYVTTGKDLWGSYIQIRSGLTMDDYIAFPYGNDTTEGAETHIAELMELYNY